MNKKRLLITAVALAAGTALAARQRKRHHKSGPTGEMPHSPEPGEHPMG